MIWRRSNSFDLDLNSIESVNHVLICVAWIIACDLLKSACRITILHRKVNGRVTAILNQLWQCMNFPAQLSSSDSCAVGEDAPAITQSGKI